MPGHEVRCAAREEKRRGIVALNAKRVLDIRRRLCGVLVPIRAPLRVRSVAERKRPQSVRQSKFGSNCDGPFGKIGGDIEIVKLLLAHGANPRLATSDGQGPIILATAARTGGTGFPNARMAGVVAPRREVIEVDVAGQKNGNGPPVNPTVELIKLLAASGADVNLIAKRHFLQRTRGGSALHYATRAGNKEAMAALVELGIDVNAKDEDGLTALDYAMGRGYVPFLQQAQAQRKDLADLLRNWGAKVELDKMPNWPPQGAAVGTAVYDAVIWPVDPVGP